MWFESRCMDGRGNNAKKSTIVDEQYTRSYPHCNS